LQMQMNNERKDTTVKWYTVTEYVDVETGEIITKSEYERNYYATGIIQKTTEKNHKYGITKITKECRRNGQTRLF